MGRQRIASCAAPSLLLFSLCAPAFTSPLDRHFPVHGGHEHLLTQYHPPDRSFTTMLQRPTSSRCVSRAPLPEKRRELGTHSSRKSRLYIQLRSTFLSSSTSCSNCAEQAISASIMMKSNALSASNLILPSKILGSWPSASIFIIFIGILMGTRSSNLRIGTSISFRSNRNPPAERNGSLAFSLALICASPGDIDDRITVCVLRHRPKQTRKSVSDHDTNSLQKTYLEDDEYEGLVQKPTRAPMVRRG